MPLPLILTKFKGLLPLAVVGGAVAITIKLLTQETPTASKIMQVKAEEDIKEVEDYEEVLEDEPKPEEEEDEAEAGGDDSNSDQDKEEQTQQQSQEQEEQQASGRSFIKGEMGDLFSKILGTDKE